jgi:hypothetical protein
MILAENRTAGVLIAHGLADWRDCTSRNLAGCSGLSAADWRWTLLVTGDGKCVRFSDIY